MAEGQRPSVTERASFAERAGAVKARLSIGALIERTVKLSGSSGAAQRRAACPFHQGKSASFAVFKSNSGNGSAYCFGCQWSGDLIKFFADSTGCSPAEALAMLEAELGIGGGAGCSAVPDRGPVQRRRNPAAAARKPEKVLIETIEMARAIWRRARIDHASVRRYFMGRGVPAAVLTDARLVQFRYLAICPLQPWEIKGPADHNCWPRDALNAPAVVAMVRRPQLLDGPAGPTLDFVPVGLHVTYLNPAGSATMVRRKPWARADDEDPWFPKRKMLGPVGGGAVMLGTWSAGAPLFVGEGNETVLSGMALAGAPPGAVGVATLSLDNLQGQPRKWNAKSGPAIWPLFKIEPDAGRRPFTIPGHNGPVRVLVDSDMAPLRGQKVVEAKGGPIVERAITGAERARICAELAVKGWRAAGVPDVAALRPPAGMDFNDVVQDAFRGEAA